MLKTILLFAAWLVVLVVGYALIAGMTRPMAMAGSGAGTGVFSYWFRAKYYLSSDDTSHGLLIGPVYIEGEADPRFALWGHQSPKYRQVSIEWDLFVELQESKGKAIADLDNMTLRHKNEVQPLSLKNFSTMLGLEGEPESKTAAGLYAFLKSARDGTLPVPNHHGHRLSDPLEGHMQHFASGPSILPFEVAWVIGWCWFGIIKLRQRWSTPGTLPAGNQA